MSTVRKRVHAIAVIWLLCQVATIAAFVPDNCCVAHTNERAEKAKQEACHEAEPPEPRPGDACPMQHADGAACPMHSSTPAKCCVMTNGCDGPGTQLSTLFSYVAMIERPAPVATQLDVADLDRLPSSPLIDRTTAPDAPPPKA
jgi:hypothetical protein